MTNNYLSRWTGNILVTDPFNLIADLISGSNDTVGIIVLTILVSGTAVSISSLIGIPLGIKIARSRLNESRLFITVLNTMVGTPPVVLGLVLYLLFFNRGLLAWVDILFTPWIMVFSQFLLTFPIVLSITRSSVADVSSEVIFTLETLGAAEDQINTFLFTEVKQGIYVGIIAALGRALSEVGALLIVGGNIKGSTRVMTTAIVTETSKGNFEVAIVLGVMLMAMTFAITAIVTLFQLRSDEK